MASISFVTSNTKIYEVLVEERGNVRTITLNRPRQLNCLYLPMISRLLELFLSSEEDLNVKLIILKGKGRAFCAGGDVAVVVHDLRQGSRRAQTFFKKMYTLNYVMATYKKIQVSILNGIVMGAGAGLSMHGRFRVVTENSVFAMPETGLGYFPDVGASYFLSRLPGFFGEYLGLTGSRLNGAEMLACGLATHYVPSHKLPSLEEALHKLNSSDPNVISATINEYSIVPTFKGNTFYQWQSLINSCFSRRTVEEIIISLEIEASQNKNAWISSSINSLKNASPTCLKISLRSIREGRFQCIRKCLDNEFRLNHNFIELGKDFVEGFRATLLDKDNNPKWNPSKLELVNEHMVDRFFSKIDKEDWEDLQLPSRLDMWTHAIAKL